MTRHHVLPRHPIFFVGVVSLVLLFTGLLKPSPVKFAADSVQARDADIQENKIQNLHDQIRTQQHASFAGVKAETAEKVGNRKGKIFVQETNSSDLAKPFEGVQSKTCLTASCVEKIAKSLARAFPEKNKEQWCFPKSSSSSSAAATTTNSDLDPKHHGLILVKVPKTASSTMAGVVLRLAHRHQCDMNFVHWGHVLASKDYAQRNVQKSSLLLSVRNPANQLISNVFWSYITLRDKTSENITDEHILQYVMGFKSTQGTYRLGQGGHTLQYASLTKVPVYAAWSKTTLDVINPEATIARAKAILEGYDFIAVVERMDESLVALSLLLGVPVGDVLVTSSKVSAPPRGIDNSDSKSNADRVPYVYSQRRQRCLPMVPTEIPPIVQRFFDSDYFRSQVYGDYILHAAASRSLDLTIERLGRDRFQAALKEYRYWKNKERDECAPRVEFPCSSSGKVQLEVAEKSCYESDLGCGYQCIDEMLARGVASD